MEKLRPDLKTNRDLKKAILKACDDNHLWINAFTLVRPSPETYRAIGEQIVSMLKNRDNLLPALYPGKDKGKIIDIAHLTPCLYLYINQS